MGSITAIILAGGFGTRLRPVVSDRSKVIADVAGQPFLRHLLDQIADARISSVVLCTGYMRDQVKQTIGHMYRNIDVMYSEEDTPLGTGGAVKKALALVKDDSVVVLNGDSYCQVNLADVVDFHDNRHVPATIVASYQNDRSRYGGLVIDEEGLVQSFVEKSPELTEGWINAGIYVFQVDALSLLPETTPSSLERDLFPRLVRNGLTAYKADDRFIDIGTPDSYAAAQRFFREAAI